MHIMLGGNFQIWEGKPSIFYSLQLFRILAFLSSASAMGSTAVTPPYLKIQIKSPINNISGHLFKDALTLTIDKYRRLDEMSHNYLL